jgi:hypothetical protein
MTNWLRPAEDTHYRHLDLSPVAGRLASLELAFGSVGKARKGIDQTPTTVPTPQRAALLAQLRQEADQAIARQISDIRAGFGDLLATAQANQRHAARDFAASDDGRQYLQGLAAFGTVAAHMPPDALASKLHSLIDAGLVGQARALAEAASLLDDGSPQRAAVNLAVQRANREAVTEQEATTAAELAYVQNASDTFQLWTGTIPSRVDDAVNTGEDTHSVGVFSPTAILGTSGATE